MNISNQLDVPRTMSKSHKVYTEVKKDLAKGLFAHGEKFYSISEISTRFQVSPGTSQKVLQELSKTGHIFQAKGRGYLVNGKVFLQEHNKSNDKKNNFNHVERHVICYVMRGQTIHSQTAKFLSNLSFSCSKKDFRLEVTSDELVNFKELLSRPDLAGLVIESSINLTIEDTDVPVLCFGHYSGNSPRVISVTLDAEQMGEMVIRCLSDLGHYKIGFLSVEGSDGKINSVFFSLFMQGVRKGCKKYNLLLENFEIAIRKSSDCNEVSASDYTKYWIEKFVANNVTSIIAASWSTVMEIVSLGVNIGIKIPEDISVVSFGESDMTPHINPKISRFVIDLEECAKMGINIIDNFIKGGELTINNVYLPVELLYGESLGNAKKQDVNNF